MNFFARLFLNAGMLWLAAYLIDGITLTNNMVGVLWVAFIFGFVNAIVKPIIQLLSLPFILLSFGFALLIINALMLVLTDALSSNLTVEGFWSAFWGALFISVAGWITNQLFGTNEKKKVVEQPRHSQQSRNPNIIEGEFH